jgi:hypothetical protein
MKRFALYASVLAAIVLGADGLAKAADVSASDSLPKKAPPPAKESTPATCSTVADFVFTNCQLSWYGITVYGIIDAGVGWQSHGAPFNGTSAVSETYLISKYSNGAHWGIAANGLSQSNIGIKGTEQFAPGWNFIFDVQAGFDPYSLRFADGPASVAEWRRAVDQPDHELRFEPSRSVFQFSWLCRRQFADLRHPDVFSAKRSHL